MSDKGNRARLRAIIWCAVSSEPQNAPDKISLEEQERAGLDYANAQDYEVVKIFRWDGYSRWESDPIAALEDFAAQGRYEYHELREMWRKRAYDVFICYTHSRPGRSFTMQAWVIENSIRAGARVYRIQGGWIDSHDYAWQIGIGGVVTTSEVDRLVAGRKAAMPRRAERGLFTGSRPPLSHVVLRDANGDAVGMALDDTKYPLWRDLARLLLEGVSYSALEDELFKLGHTNTKGKPLSQQSIHKILHTPTFWGHLAVGYTRRTGRTTHREYGPWAYDEAITPPEGVVVYRDRVPAAYTGELAEQVKAEMRRRKNLAGQSRPYRTRRYAGFFVCGRCGSTMAHTYMRRNYEVLRCYSKYQKQRLKRCENQPYLPISVADRFIRELLTDLVEERTPRLSQPEDETKRDKKRLADVEIALAACQNQIDTLLEQQSLQPSNVQAYYRDKIAKLVTEADALTDELTDLESKISETLYQGHDEKIAVEDLRKAGVDRFFQWSEQEQHQWLSRYLRDRKFIVIDKTVTHIARKLPRKK